MAARLTVVISQSASRDARMSDLEETLVAEIMMRPGLDATMIGPIEQVQLDDTDFLCVSSFNYSFAFLSWLAVEELDQHWQRLGLDGSIVNLNSRDRMRSDGVRPIYHIQLEPGLNTGRTIDQLSQVLNDRNVATVSINLPGMQTNPPSHAPEARADANVGSRDTVEVHPRKVAATRHPEAVDSSPTRQSSTEYGLPGVADDEPEWDHLDKLVEDFDALDL